MRPFISNYLAMEKLLIVDVADQYTCQYTSKVYIIVFSHAISAPSMDNIHTGG